MLWCCIDMRLADDRREHLPTRLTSAPGGYSMPLPRSGVAPTSLVRVLCRSQKSPGGEFRVSPRDLLSGVSLPGSGTAGVSVDERVEGASRRPSWFVLLDMDQVEQAAQVCPLVETHLSVASFDDLNQASHEVETVRTVIPLTVSSVDFHSDWLVHVFLLGARVRPGGRGEAPAEPRGYREPNTPIARD